MNALADTLATWTSYRPSDFLMFAPRSYWRLAGGLNAALWPLHAVWLLAGLGAAALLLRRHRRAAPLLGALLAAACAATALAWHAHTYSAINTGAPWLGAAFGMQAALLLLAAAAAWHAPVAAAVPARRGLALLLLATALLAYPLLGLALGRPLVQAETLGVMPDPTLLGVLAAALLLQRWWLWPLPLAGCALAGLAGWVMGEALAPLLPVAGAAAVGVVSAAAASARRARAT